MNEHDNRFGWIGWLAITFVLAGLAYWFGYAGGMGDAARMQYEQTEFDRQRRERNEAEDATTRPIAEEPG